MAHGDPTNVRIVEADALERHRSALLTHLADPTTVVIDKLLIQSWGQKPD